MGAKIYADVDYEDEYVQPLLLEALKKAFPSDTLVLLDKTSQLPAGPVRFLQWRQYESVDFERLMEHTTSTIANSYVIRKALIRKHYLANTVAHWLSKNPNSILKTHVKPSVEFEVDFAEFLDDALVDAFDLKDSWDRNEGKSAAEREWWILKPGMSDRGQGIRLFSTEEELTEIFEEWDPSSDDEDDNGNDHAEQGVVENPGQESGAPSNGIITSQLRHFVAQPYIHPPLLLDQPHPSADRKFHIRTYVVAVGALKVYVYRPMLALFAPEPYRSDSNPETPNDSLSRHLTNTCLQTGEREGSVHAFWSLPSKHCKLSAGEANDWREDVFNQICRITGDLFEAAARSMGIHFQARPNAFEIFGLDFLVDDAGTAWLLEVNSFPDFAQTGDELKGLITGLFEGAIEKAIKPFFGAEGCHGSEISDEEKSGQETMVRVLNLDLGHR